MVWLRLCRTWLREFLVVMIDVRNLLLLVLTSVAMLRADDAFSPPVVDEAVFEVLFTSSPFTRTVDPASSIILTGVASIEGEVVATLLDTGTMKSQVVSKTANAQGWQLIGVGGAAGESATWTAKVQVAGGEVIAVRYQKPPPKKGSTVPGSVSSPGGAPGNAPPLSSGQLAEAKNAAVNYREGFSSDGYPRAPPPEMVAKLSRLSVGQREEINRQMLGLRNQGLGLDERRKIYENLVDRSTQGRR
jgi:hypothetical protein